jgi:hypothetical protein
MDTPVEQEIPLRMPNNPGGGVDIEREEQRTGYSQEP